MNILVHRVETYLQRKVLLQGIAGRQSQLGSLIGLDDACLATCFQRGALCREVAFYIMVYVTRPQRVEYGITQTGSHRQLFRERTLVVDVGCALQRLFPLQLFCLDERLLTHRLIPACLHVVVLQGESIVERLLLRQPLTNVQLSP